MDTKTIQNYVKEDAPKGDITAQAIFGTHKADIQAKIIAKESLVVSGFDTVKKILQTSFPKVKLIIKKKDGSVVSKGTILALVKGPATQVLQVERLCLNFLQQLSGVATLTSKYVQIAKPYRVSILDTRKTTPGLRVEEKKAVRDGCGENHRMNLSDQYLIKDNHIDVAGGVIEAIEKVRDHQKRKKSKALIEVEVRDESEFCEALLMGVDIIMLDNMTTPQIRKMVKMRNERKTKKKPQLEISGGVTIKNLNKYVKLGIDRISVGAITHSAPAVDISMLIE